MSGRFIALIAAALVAFTAPGMACAEPKVQVHATDAEVQQIKASLTLGEALYNYDQAAWHTTDTMLADLPDPASTGLRGWVVTPADNGWLVTYWKPDGDGFSGVYSAVWTGKDVIERKLLEGADTNLTDGQVELIRAGRATDPATLERCIAKPFNTVIMPSGKADGSIYVYYLTPQTSLDSVPLGGHFRFEVLGGKVVGERRFAKSCISLPIKHDVDGKGKLASLVITHLLDPVPTDVHVFSTYATKLPLFVMTMPNKSLWVVEISNGSPRIRLLKRD